MNRNFGRPSSGQFGGGGGGRYDRDDGRYDGFYNRGGRSDGRSGDWGSNRDRGFFNARGGSGFDDRRDDRGLGGPMMAALQAQQAQSILAAMQANRFGASGLLPTPGSRYANQSGGSRGRERGGRGGGSGYRSGDKRRQESDNVPGYGKHKERRPDSKPKKEEDKPEEVPPTEVDVPLEDVAIPDSLMDAVENLRRREKVERNVADEDVSKLMTFCFTGKGYQCLTCGVMLSKEAGFQHHVMGKSHVMKVIEDRGNGGVKYQPIRDILDIDLAIDDWYERSAKARELLQKQARLLLHIQKEIEAKEMASYNSNPANFFKCENASRKSAKLTAAAMVFTHLVETTMEVQDFTGDRFFGCEFVKPESGFNCRLCNVYIKDSSNVLPHIDSKSHRNMYQNFLRKNPNYEKRQRDQNNELAEALRVHEGENVVLHETKRTSEKEFLDYVEPILTRVPDLMAPKEAKKDEDSEERGDDKLGVKSETKGDDDPDLQTSVDALEDHTVDMEPRDEYIFEGGNEDEHAAEGDESDMQEPLQVEPEPEPVPAPLPAVESPVTTPTARRGRGRGRGGR